MDPLQQPYSPFLTGSVYGNHYANPWFTVANQFVPRNLHDVIRWARFITIQSPTTSEVIRKLSTYPITDFNIDTKKSELEKKYKEVLKSIKLKESLQNIGFEYFTIGNCFVSMYLPIHRSLKCPTCGTVHSAKNSKWIEFKQYKFVGKCPGCNNQVEFERQDSKSKDVNDINIIRWTPEHIAINHNPITGEYEYFYKIPNSIKQKIQKGDKLFVNSVPWGFVEAVKNNQDFKFDKGSIFHLQNVSTGGSVEGVAVPPLLSLFSLVFYQATLRKANEAIALDFLNPMRVVFPQAQTGNSDPSISMNMKNFVNNMSASLQRQKVDKNHILISPVPVGYQPIGGEGRNLLVSQEIEQAEQTILLALGVSRELLSGTTNWTSSSTGLRMMENLLTSYISRLHELVDWINKKTVSYLGVEYAEVKLQPFKLLDDENLKQYLMQLVQSGGASYTTFLQELGLNFSEEQERIREETIKKTENQIKTEFDIGLAQAMAASSKAKEMNENEEYKTLILKAQTYVDQLSGMSPEDMAKTLETLKVQDYTMYVLCSIYMQNMQAAAMEDPNQQGGVSGGPSGTSSQNEPTATSSEEDSSKDKDNKEAAE